jgi:hypothetical protein
MKPNRGREPSPGTTFDTNALRLAKSSSCASSLISAVVPSAAPNERTNEGGYLESSLSTPHLTRTAAA